MYFTKSFIPILKNNPTEAKIKSHQLMLRTGMIKQSSAGIYSWLPLGFKVMKKIEQIVREEQNRIGVQEILMPTIQSSDIWKESGRYEDYGEEMLRIKDRQNREMLYGPTNEELVTEIFRSSIKSYKSLPQLLYHIQWKFRDELRPRFGIMRCREFYMKDAYSFDINDDEANFSYNKFFLAYLNTFKRLKKGILRSILSFLEIFLSLKVYLSDLIVLHWSGSQIPINTNISKPAMVPCPQISTSIDGENQRIKKLP